MLSSKQIFFWHPASLIQVYFSENPCFPHLPTTTDFLREDEGQKRFDSFSIFLLKMICRKIIAKEEPYGRKEERGRFSP